MKSLSDIGEFGFIDKIAAKYSQENEQALGIGDDCSVVPLNDKEARLVTTDILIENVHFLKNKISAENLGYKALAVNLSDIAAMGGQPEEIYISIGLPDDIQVQWLEKFYRSMNELATRFDTRLMGGDTTSSREIIINILVMGIIPRANIKYRRGARPGDIICVNDYLGDSPGGLKILLEDLEIDEPGKQLIQAHNHPEPQIEEGQFLSSKSAVHSMLDVSDGIGSDIKHIIERSAVGARIEVEKIPVSEELKKTGQKYGWDILDLAINGGEDYCLLFTVASAEFKNLKSAYVKKFDSEITEIGKIQSEKYGLRYFKDGKQLGLEGGGFDHFKKQD
jgi:thiamine-monophosphate kinase